MIQEKQAQSKVLEVGQAKESIGMSLDLDSAQVLMQMLSKNLYSDPIGSTVRECASNALDSHRRAGVTDAIIVSLKINKENNYEFSVEDFGTGLDADDVENIISKYGKSTKRESNTEIGMMGLGFKSPLAYCSTFFFVCRKDGIERKYMMYEGEDVNTIDLLYETSTEERNGVKIIVPVKINDRHTFLEKIRNQLAYFESVYFDVNVQNNIVTNEFIIHRGEDFQLSEMNTDQFMHICLDNVYYPMDFAKLGINNINIPIGLRFGLSDGLFPTPNREQLIYTAQAKKTILDKITKVSDYFFDKYNENSIDCKDIHEIFNYYGYSNRNVIIGNTTIDASKLSVYTNKKFNKPEYKDYTLTDFSILYRNKDYLFYEYTTNINYTRGQFRQTVGYYDKQLNYSNAKDPQKIWVYDETFTGNKKSFIKSLLPLNSYENIRFVKKNREFHLKNKDKSHSYDNYMSMLNLHLYPRNTWRDRIQEFQRIVEELTKDFKDVDSTPIAQSWLDARKRKRVSTAVGGTKRVKLQGEINCRVTDDLQRYVHGKNSKLTPKVLNVADISSHKKLLVYGKQDSEATFDGLFAISSKQKIEYLVLSEREYKVAQTLDIHNFITIEKFMEGKNKPFKRLITAYLIHKLIDKYPYTFSKVYLLKTVSKRLHKQLDELLAYNKTNYNGHADERIYESMLVIANQHNLFDETIYTEYQQIKELLETFPFIETSMDVLPSYSAQPGHERYVNVLVDLFKYHRIRIDYTNYHLVLNQDTDILDQITDETIEELTQNP